jgi:hypothetical protein
LREIGNRFIGNGDQDHLAKVERLGHGARRGKRTHAVNHGLQLFGMPRREQHLMPGLHPQAADRAADVAPADHPDLDLACGRLRSRQARNRNSGQHRCSGLQDTAAIGGKDIIDHRAFSKMDGGATAQTIVASATPRKHRRAVQPSLRCEACQKYSLFRAE